MTTCQVRSSWERSEAAPPLRFRHIVVGVDGSPNSIEALRVAVRLGLRDRAKIEAVCAYQRYTGAQYAYGLAEIYASPGGVLDAAADAQATLENAVQEAFGRSSIDHLVLRPVEGGAFDVLSALSADADLLVVGARGYSGPLALLLGSTAQACVRHAKCPVLVVPAPQPAPQEARAGREKAATKHVTAPQPNDVMAATTTRWGESES